MRSIRSMALLAVALSLAFTSLALALAYKTGTYAAGKALPNYTQRGFELRLGVKAGSFRVMRISYPERCSSTTSSFSDEFTFLASSSASLTGAIDKHGHFSGQYRAGTGTVTVSGNVAGSKATVKGTETSTFTPNGSTAQFACSGSHTFKAQLQSK
jgi:hypothetical protein